MHAALVAAIVLAVAAGAKWCMHGGGAHCDRVHAASEGRNLTGSAHSPRWGLHRFLFLPPIEVRTHPTRLR